MPVGPPPEAGRRRTGARTHVTRIHPLSLPARGSTAVTSIWRRCPQFFREAALKPQLSLGRCVVVVGPVDNVDNHCFRRSAQEFLSTGLVENPVGNSGRLWTEQTPLSFSTRRPQSHPQVFPIFSTTAGDAVVGSWVPLSTGRPRVTHRAEAVVHSLSTGLSTDFGAWLWITRLRCGKNFFPDPRAYLSNQGERSVHRVFHRSPELCEQRSLSRWSHPLRPARTKGRPTSRKP